MTEPRNEQANSAEHPAPIAPSTEAAASFQESPDGQLTASSPTGSSASNARSADSVIADENSRLREENIRLRQELRSTITTARERPHRVRRISTAIFLVLTCLGLLLSSLTLWVNNEFLNTSNWIALVGPLGQDPHVVNAVSAYTANEVVSILNVQQRAQEALPPRAQFLAVPLTSVIHDFAQKRVANLMHTPQFEQIWISANRYVQAEVLAALRGQTKNVIIDNGTVTLNLIPIIRQALAALQQTVSGLIPASVHLPDVSQLQVPSQARAKLAAALGVPVSSNFGVITLFSSEQLAKAQQALQAFDLLTILLPIITVLLLVATLWSSPDRRRTLIQLGIGVAITFLIARIVFGYIQGQVIAGIANPTGQSIAGVVIPAAAASLLTLAVLILTVGIVVAIIAYLAGKPEWFAAAYGQGKVAYGQLGVGYRHARDEISRRRARPAN